MVVLIVDDQVSVVSGLFCGVRWGKIGIEKVYKAYNAYEAKKIIAGTQIDILLCDIEMPVESGLDLCDWLRENKYAALCIFLTAHADFMYAQKAVKLNVFDYILQPAPYSEIEQSVEKAVRRLRQQRVSDEIYSYGEIVYSSREKFLDAVFRPVFTERGYDVCRELGGGEKLGIKLSPGSNLYLALVAVQGAAAALCGRADVESVVRTHFASESQNTILFAVSGGAYGVITYPDGGWRMPYDAYAEQMQSVQNEIAVRFRAPSAVWVCGECTLADIGTCADRIRAYRDTLLEDASGFFDLETKLPEPGSLQFPNMRVWQDMIRDGHPEIMITDTQRFLAKMPSGSGSADVLKKFYQDVMQLAAVVLSEQNTSMTDLFEDADAMENVLSSYKSAERMEKLVAYFTEYFVNEQDRKKDCSVIQKVTEYIEENISEDLRREEIAGFVRLNPSYLSRIFRKETGKSLKEFITDRKMDMAQTLLQSTNLTVSMIAVKAGYTNFSLFSQNYRRAKGKLPSEDRGRTGV